MFQSPRRTSSCPRAKLSKPMKILIVTGLPGPVKDIWSGKMENEITHAPQFFHPWYKLVQRGHQVDFIVASNFNEPANIKVDWFREENILANVYDPFSDAPWYKRLTRRAKRFAKLLYHTNKALSETDYDFVYCKAFYEGLAGNIVANLRGVPCGVRSMGTMLYKDFEDFGVLGTALRRPVEFITFKMDKEFFIMTDDGTHGDKVYEEWRPRKDKYEYLFWKTGVNTKGIDDIEPSMPVPEHPYLFFAARIDDWKRHDRLIEVLRMLHEEGEHLHMYFAGSVQSPGYLQKLEDRIAELGLGDYVHFLGPIKQDDVKSLAYHAVANPSMYDYSNLGNVFFEIWSAGAVVVGLNDGSLDDYVIDDDTGFLVDDEKAACDAIVRLLREDGLGERIRERSIASAKEKVLSIDERFDREVELIERVAQEAGMKRGVFR